MNTNDPMLFLGFVVLWFALLGGLAWLSDRLLERRRPTIPPPQKRAIVGETHKPWM